jgi:hypothetical protein
MMPTTHTASTQLSRQSGLGTLVTTSTHLSFSAPGRTARRFVPSAAAKHREIACGKTKFLPAVGVFLLPHRSTWLTGPGLELLWRWPARCNNRGRELVHQYRSRSRRHHVSGSRPIFGGSRRLRRGDLVGRHLASDCNLRRSILAAHVCDNWRVSSVLLASSLLDKPGISIRPCIPRAKHRSKKRAMVGRETSTSSFAFRYRTGCAFTQAQGLRVQSCRLDFLSTARRYRPGEGFRFCFVY